METVTNAATAAANTVQRAIFGDSTTHDERTALDNNTQNIGRDTTGASAVIDEPHHSGETATDSNPFRHSTGAPEHVTSSPYNQREKGELNTDSTDYNTRSSVFSEDLPKATDRNPNSPFIGNTDNVSSLGGKDVLKEHHENPANRSTLGKTELNAPLGKTESGSHGTHDHSASLGKTELGKTEFGNQPSGSLEKTELGKTELGGNDEGTSLDKAELGKTEHGSTNLGKTEGKTKFGKTEFAKSAQGKTELGNFSDDSTSSNRNTDTSNTLTGDRGRKEPVIGHGNGIPHTSDLGASPGSGAQPTHKQQGAAASNMGGPKPLGGMKLDNESHGEGTGEKYERSTGLAADGGDFDASRPGAGREADRLLEEKGIHRTAGGSTNLADEQAKKHHGLHHKAPGESQGSGSDHKGLTTKIKGK
ncbi:hypothetical protein L873DRAFT_1836019 [Choiromyces venosus 120613-1]|uniref:Uncharacterized protein n=1 Tax=Choiromyces venosus 120613-1 TaxID=1336337 RepID=A0A3N4JIM4_9PEZI|nr:hypothetical protein L873DRAFT_1836019 [Choiromyces venosus 120613-1]